MGGSRDSGHSPSLDAKAKLAVLPPCHERSLGQCREGVPDSRTGLIPGESGELPYVVAETASAMGARTCSSGSLTSLNDRQKYVIAVR